jgi:hypothetical protein
MEINIFASDIRIEVEIMDIAIWINIITKDFNKEIWVMVEYSFIIDNKIEEESMDIRLII